MQCDDDLLFELVTTLAGPFKTVIETLKDIIADTYIEITPIVYSDDGTQIIKKGGLKITDTSKAKDIFVCLKLDGTAFSKFFCKKKKIKIPLELNNLYNIIKMIGNDDILSLYMIKKNENCLRIKAINNKGNGIINSSINLIKLEKEKTNLQEKLNVESSITMKSQYFQKICKDLKNIYEQIEIKNIGNKLIIGSKSYLGETNIELNSKCENENEDSNKTIIQGEYELRNLILFTKCTSLCDYVDIYMSNDNPLIIKYDVSTLGKITFCAVPNKKSN